MRILFFDKFADNFPIFFENFFDFHGFFLSDLENNFLMTIDNCTNDIVDLKVVKSRQVDQNFHAYIEFYKNSPICHARDFSFKNPTNM